MRNFSFATSLTALFILCFIVDSRDHKQYSKRCRSDLHDVTWCTSTLCSNIKKKNWAQRRCYIIFSSPRLRLFWSTHSILITQIGPRLGASISCQNMVTQWEYDICPGHCVLCANALTHQWGHVSSVHLPCGDLLLCRGHRTHIEGVGAADGAGPDYTRKCYWAVLHATHAVELLLQNCGSKSAGEDEIRSACWISYF